MCPEAPLAFDPRPPGCGFQAVETRGSQWWSGEDQATGLGPGPAAQPQLVTDAPGGAPREKEARQPRVRPGVGGASPLWASVLSPEGRARRSQGCLPKGRPLQKTAARSVFAARGLESGVEAGQEGTGPTLPHRTPARPPSPVHPLTRTPTAPRIRHTRVARHVLGAGTHEALALADRGPARSRAQVGGRDETLLFRAARGWPASLGHLTQGPGPCSHPRGVFSLTQRHPTAALAGSMDPRS